VEEEEPAEHRLEGNSPARTLGGIAAARDDVTDSGAFTGLRVPHLDLDVVTFGDNPNALTVVTGIATEGDLVVGPGRDIARDKVGTGIASPAGIPSRGEISDAEVRRISS
jgi:hypothetical protein